MVGVGWPQNQYNLVCPSLYRSTYAGTMLTNGGAQASNKKIVIKEVMSALFYLGTQIKSYKAQLSTSDEWLEVCSNALMGFLPQGKENPSYILQVKIAKDFRIA